MRQQEKKLMAELKVAFGHEEIKLMLMAVLGQNLGHEHEVFSTHGLFDVSNQVLTWRIKE